MIIMNLLNSIHSHPIRSAIWFSFCAIMGFILGCISAPKEDPPFIGKWVGSTIIDSIPVSVEMIINPDKTFSRNAYFQGQNISEQWGTWTNSRSYVFFFVTTYYFGSPLKIQPNPPPDSVAISIDGINWPVIQLDPTSGAFYRVDFVKGS